MLFERKTTTEKKERKRITTCGGWGTIGTSSLGCKWKWNVCCAGRVGVLPSTAACSRQPGRASSARAVVRRMEPWPNHPSEFQAKDDRQSGNGVVTILESFSGSWFLSTNGNR